MWVWSHYKLLIGFYLLHNRLERPLKSANVVWVPVNCTLLCEIHALLLDATHIFITYSVYGWLAEANHYYCHTDKKKSTCLSLKSIPILLTFQDLPYFQTQLATIWWMLKHRREIHHWSTRCHTRPGTRIEELSVDTSELQEIWTWHQEQERCFGTCQDHKGTRCNMVYILASLLLESSLH